MHNLQTKTVSFPDQKKFLKEALFSQAVSTNANTENYQIKHCLCPKYLAIYRLDLYNFQARKTSEKWPRVKFYLLKYATIKTSNINTAEKSKINQIEMYSL